MSGAQPPSLTGASTPVTISGSKFGQNTHIDNVTVTIGGETCTVTSVNDGSIQCTITNVPTGTNTIMASINGLGKVTGSETILGQAVITGVSPAEGSTYGGTELVIDGNGFVTGSTTINIDGTACSIKEISLSQVKCLTPPHAIGLEDVDVTSNGQSYQQQNFSYTAAATPMIDDVSPDQGSVGTVVTLTGRDFVTTPGDINVTIGKLSSCHFHLILHIHVLGFIHVDWVTYKISCIERISNHHYL